MVRVGEVTFIAKDGKLFLLHDNEKESGDWSFYALSKIPISSKTVETLLNIYDSSNLKLETIKTVIDLKLEKLDSDEKESYKDEDRYSIIFFTDEYSHELFYSIYVSNIGLSKASDIVPISEKLEAEGIHHRLKVKIKIESIVKI